MGPTWESTKPDAAAGAGICVKHCISQRGNGEHGDRVTEAVPFALKEIGRDKRREEAAETKEEVHQVECRGTMGLAHAAHQRVGSGDNNAASYAKKEEQGHDAAKAAGAWQQKESECDAGQAENEADLVAFAIEQRTDGEGCDHQAQSLRESDGAVLRRSQVETVRQVGEDRAQHCGDHSVDKNGEDGAENEHAY